MRKIKLLMILLPIFFITGCTSYIELNELGIVSLLGIDYTENEYHLYINIVEGEQEDGALQKESLTYHAEGETLDQAFHKLYLKSNKKIYLSHMNTLILSEKAINQKLKEIITYLLGQKEIRNNFQLVQLQSKMETIFNKKIEAKEFNDLIQTNSQYMATTNPVTFESFLEELLIDHNSFLPLVTYQKELEIQGLSLIKNYQILETLSPEDTLLLNILKNEINQTIYHNTTIYKNQTSLKYQKDKITFQIQMEVNEQQESLKKELEKDLNNLLTRYQKKDYDIMKLEYRMKQNHLFLFQDNKTNLSKIKLNFEIHIKTTDNYLERKLPL